ncbi:hypothetical protein L3X38_011693 [Prunus dulcis]|uniref:Uncharacterized protein n=1 Tax=Prunus dulcis TaxID=3755 RepID=A0AAD4WKN6_PRUDU|nr:hypothetical protein L3X38_011693 [Prunus dulcis]
MKKLYVFGNISKSALLRALFTPYDDEDDDLEEFKQSWESMCSTWMKALVVCLESKQHNKEPEGVRIGR